MKRVRQLLFLCFTSLYLVLCPFMILYSLGYVFKPGSEHGIVKTGLISVTSVPSNASIYIGSRRYTKRTPAILRDLLPGEYDIKLALKGYQPWAAKVSVEAERASVLEHVLLLPERWKPTMLLRGPFDSLTAIPESHELLLTQGKRLGNTLVYRMKTEKGWPLLLDDSPLQEANVLSMVRLRKLPILLLYAVTGEGPQWLWVEPRGRESRVEPLGSIFPRGTARTRWDGADRAHLFALQDGELNRVDLDAKVTFRGLAEAVQGYGVTRHTLYLLKDNMFQRSDLDGKEPELLLSDPVLGRELFGGKGIFHIEALAKDLVLFLGDRGELLCNRLPYRLVDQGVLGLEYDAQGEQVLLWRKDKVGVLDFPRSESSERVFEMGPRLRWMFEQGRNIREAFWVYEGSHILVHDQDRLVLVDVGVPGASPVSAVAQVKKDSSIGYAEDTGSVYYLDPNTGALMMLELLPRWELLPRSFRETSPPEHQTPETP